MNKGKKEKESNQETDTAPTQNKLLNIENKHMVTRGEVGGAMSEVVEGP